MSLSVAAESPLTDDGRRLLGELMAYVETLYPNAGLPAPGPEEVAEADYTFFVARADGKAIGCAALRADAEGYCEMKRMYVAQKGRRRGVAKALLSTVEQEAARRGYGALRLHSAKAMQSAIALYHAAGYRDRARFWKYPDSDISVYMEKALPRAETA